MIRWLKMYQLTYKEWVAKGPKITQAAYHLLFEDLCQAEAVISESLGLLKAGSIKEAKKRLEEYLESRSSEETTDVEEE